MARDKNKKKLKVVAKKPSILVKIVLGLITVLVIASGIAFYFDQEDQLARIQNNKSELERKLDQAYARNGELLALQEKVDTDEYVEKVARDQLGMVKPDEVVFEDG